MVFGGTESTKLNLLSWLCLVFIIMAFGLKNQVQKVKINLIRLTIEQYLCRYCDENPEMVPYWNFHFSDFIIIMGNYNDSIG